MYLHCERFVIFNYDRCGDPICMQNVRLDLNLREVSHEDAKCFAYVSHVALKTMRSPAASI